MLFLRQSTAVVVQFGPFVDKTDGVTPETGLVSALDHASTGILLSKNGGALTIRHATVTASSYDAYAMYRVTLDTTDTNTLGTLRAAFIETATCLPVWQDFLVVTANEWDSMMASSIRAANVTQLLGTAWLTPAVAGTPDVNAKQISGDATAADNAESFFDGTGYAGTNNVIPTVTTVTNLTNAPTAGDLTATMKTSVTTAASSATPAVTVSDKTGFSLSTAGILAIWHQLTSAIVTSSTIGKLLKDFITGDAFARLGAPAGASVSADIAAAKVDTAAILVDTNELQTDWVDGGRLDVILDARASQTSVNTIDDFLDTEIATLVAGLGALTASERNSIADAIFARSLGAEGYAADGAVPTLAQFCFMMLSGSFEFAISGTTITAKKLDGTTTSMTFTLDSATAPTSRTRAS